MVEDTRLYSTHKSPTGEDLEENEVETLAQIPRYENVREPGSDVRQGELVLERGTVVHSAGGEVGTLAFVGRSSVRRVPPLSSAYHLIDSNTGESVQEARGGVAEHRERVTGRAVTYTVAQRRMGRHLGHEPAVVTGRTGRAGIRGHGPRDCARQVGTSSTHT